MQILQEGYMMGVLMTVTKGFAYSCFAALVLDLPLPAQSVCAWVCVHAHRCALWGEERCHAFKGTVAQPLWRFWHLPCGSWCCHDYICELSSIGSDTSTAQGLGKEELERSIAHRSLLSITFSGDMRRMWTAEATGRWWALYGTPYKLWDFIPECSHVFWKGHGLFVVP